MCERFFQLGKSHEILKFYQKIMEFWVSLGLINEYWGNNNNSVIAMQFLVWIDSLNWSDKYIKFEFLSLGEN